MIYKLKQLKIENLELMKIFHDWKSNELEFEKYTCRPIGSKDTFDEYVKTMKDIVRKGIKTYYLQDSENNILGKITMFDLNPRNRSAEFGYYFPKENRGKGYGDKLVKLFIEEVFSHIDFDLNKIYATTASGNIGSIKLLEKNGFHLDGVMREHYWLNDGIEDQLCYSLLKREWKNIV